MELTALRPILHPASHETKLRTTAQAFRRRIGIGKNGLILPYPLIGSFSVRLSVIMQYEAKKKVPTRHIPYIPTCLANLSSEPLEQGIESGFRWHRRSFWNRRHISEPRYRHSSYCIVNPMRQGFPRRLAVSN